MPKKFFCLDVFSDRLHGLFRNTKKPRQTDGAKFLFDDASCGGEVARMAQADENFFDAAIVRQCLSFAAQGNFRGTAFVVDNLNVREPRDNARAQRLKKSLLCRETCGVGGSGIFSAT